MIRRLNYTNRLKIDRSSVAVKLIKLPGQPLSFSTVLRLDKYNLPLGANVYVEAYKQTLYTGSVLGPWV